MAEKGVHARITFQDRQRIVYMEQVGREVVLNIGTLSNNGVSIVLAPCDARLIAGWLADLAHVAECTVGSREAVIETAIGEAPARR